MTENHLPPTLTEAESETLDLHDQRRTFVAGEIVGERYQILALLGRGGMGEVWHGFDLKLRVDVALKALRSDIFKTERRRESLRQEVRAAREVVSPNVCRVFDLHEMEGLELVSMEFVDGQTLLEVMRERAPLDLQEAQDIASQFLAGLEAIHQIGLVHRDIKPENIMLTRAGRVVVMDFGIAREEHEGSGTVSGTAAYMAPEQAAGQAVDARADVYSAGVVLAEMLNPDGLKDRDSRESVWEAVRAEPAKIQDSPWSVVIAKAVAKDREHRYGSAHDLTRALEHVTLRIAGADDLHPYPGLASFTEDDAEYFFGREAEIEQMWRKLEGPARMLALVGPSGAGKSSFIAAGLAATVPTNWGILRTTPGNTAIASLRSALTPELAGETTALQEMMANPDDPDVIVGAVQSWGKQHARALLVVDQFEELFTQNSAEEQRGIAELLRRFVIEADIHVLLSMRDDFAAACNTHESLRPIFQDLTVLDPPSGANLRRAIVQPATKCGYRFEDDDLVDEILAEVEGERGALPLLAFAAARLWEMRDRDTGLLTRQAYKDIGGVGGALARHAESTVDLIGTDRIATVREIFRNLVTAEGTRAVREWHDLLSVFDDRGRKAADEALRELIDARLLISYEVREDENDPIRRVEIIHESLLANWPRLVRWQTQDQEGAQIREELRQAARAWVEHGRHDDRLWTGTAFREYQLWRGRYPGGLTDLEEAFGSAMTSLASRHRRRRRLAVTTVITVLLTGLAVLGSFWLRSVRETRRAEAANLLSLGQVELESYPTATVAYATASLELADSKAARRLALEALWKGPTALVINEEDTGQIKFTPDGSRLGLGFDDRDGRLSFQLVNDDGSTRPALNPMGTKRNFSFSPDGEVFLTTGGRLGNVVELWSASDDRRLAKGWTGEGVFIPKTAWSPDRAVFLVVEGDLAGIHTLGFDGVQRQLGTVDITFPDDRQWLYQTDLNSTTGQWLGVVVDNEVFVVEIRDDSLSEPMVLGRHEGTVSGTAFDPEGFLFATASEQGIIKLWSVGSENGPVTLRNIARDRPMPGGTNRVLVRFTRDGRFLEASEKRSRQLISWVWSLESGEPVLLRRFDLGASGVIGWRVDPATGSVAKVGPDLKIRLWSMAAPADADPLLLQRGEVNQFVNNLDFHPLGRALATLDLQASAIWPLARTYPAVIRRHTNEIFSLTFGPNGEWLASGCLDGKVGVWPLHGEAPPPGGILMDEPGVQILGLAALPNGKALIAATSAGLRRISLKDGEIHGMFDDFQARGVAISPDGRLASACVATARRFDQPISWVYRVWEVESGEELWLFDPEGGDPPRGGLPQFGFDMDGRLLFRTPEGLRAWNPETAETVALLDATIENFGVNTTGRRVAMVVNMEEPQGAERAAVLDLETGGVTFLETHGSEVVKVRLNPEGTIAVSGDVDGVLRVGLAHGAEPHLLFGHEHKASKLAIDPLGRWIASGGEDHTVRLWPMPDLSKPPLHTLPRAELIAKLKTLTNLRVVRDPESSTGWTLTHDPFPGWETVPTW